ncbi:hypothetical protein CAPTEDRAFT_180503 [Capitella teleta]|uniref:EGF-like domain-containing protein n=1 Tax=Capitella teleta TaxID=283909 RepID=R7V7C7_CAPTE|nr:hypothetical protein CAPTEDRAFT_180503 [Capitella teleta]|eukprot:ELU14469.1 hypothetical protein CAPTEDRAFT_180503 [Capitella teleta]
MIKDIAKVSRLCNQLTQPKTFIDCEPGFWGIDCQECKCSEAVCNAIVGCTECPSGFKGANCDEDIDECSSNPCTSLGLGAGVCNNTRGTYVCECASGYEGDLCNQLVDVCASFTDPTEGCQQNANCSNTGQPNGYECTCATPDYNGVNCSTNVNACATYIPTREKLDPCFNGATCVDAAYGYTCTCSSGFTGFFCVTALAEESTTAATTTASESTTSAPDDEAFPVEGIVVATILGVVGVLAGVFIGIGLYQRFKMSKLKTFRLKEDQYSYGSDYYGTPRRNPGRRWARRPESYSAPYTPNPYAQSPYGPPNWSMLRNAAQQNMQAASPYNSFGQQYR